ncbi:MAG TPA: hypothetical protein VMW34_02580, partial [Anaerolineales bacterium]|nr:hypothetical protein [Anaerolineales bacterium]
MSDPQENLQTSLNRGLYWGAWVLAIALVVFAVYLGWRVTSVKAGSNEQAAAPASTQSLIIGDENLILPQLSEPAKLASISRETNLYTVIPTRPRQ